MSVSVHHIPKGTTYEYPDRATAEEHAKQACADGKLVWSDRKDGSIEIRRAEQKARRSED
jgi:hypothetical protein